MSDSAPCVLQLPPALTPPWHPECCEGHISVGVLAWTENLKNETPFLGRRGQYWGLNSGLSTWQAENNLWQSQVVTLLLESQPHAFCCGYFGDRVSFFPRLVWMVILLFYASARIAGQSLWHLVKHNFLFNCEWFLQ
jgi:hypothetical protein